MKELEDAIRKYGIGLGNDVVKVDMFLNHRIDTGLLMKMGETFADEFREDAPTLVLTVEASGIAMAVAAAAHLGNIPVLFAKKSATVVQTENMLQAQVYSFTHKTQNTIRVNRDYLPQGSRVLVVYDFLANGIRMPMRIIDRHNLGLCKRRNGAKAGKRQQQNSHGCNFTI